MWPLTRFNVARDWFAGLFQEALWVAETSSALKSDKVLLIDLLSTEWLEHLKGLTGGLYGLGLFRVTISGV